MSDLVLCPDPPKKESGVSIARSAQPYDVDFSGIWDDQSQRSFAVLRGTRGYRVLCLDGNGNGNLHTKEVLPSMAQMSFLPCNFFCGPLQFTSRWSNFSKPGRMHYVTRPTFQQGK